MASSRSGSSHVTPISSDNVTKRISNIEIFACFWLGRDLHKKTKDNEETQKELRKIMNHLEIFENCDECEQAIQEAKQEKIILISSNSLAHQIVPRVHDLPQLNACYICSQDKPIDKQWTNNYAKVCNNKQV
jgi:hypothetical protein